MIQTQCQPKLDMYLLNETTDSWFSNIGVMQQAKQFSNCHIRPVRVNWLGNLSTVVSEQALSILISNSQYSFIEPHYTSIEQIQAELGDSILQKLYAIVQTRNEPITDENLRRIAKNFAYEEKVHD